MCASYHGEGVYEELIRRLEYEFVFGMIGLSDLTSDRWMGRCNRDNGHYERIRRLVRRL